MPDRETHEEQSQRPDEQRGLGTDLLGQAAAGLGVGVGGALTTYGLSKLPNRPPKPEPKKVELPPGVSRD